MKTIAESLLLGISTPYRKSGILFDKFKQSYGRDDDDVLFIKAPSITLNPTSNQAEIDKELADDPEGARAEWLAEFRSDISAFIDRDMIARCVPDPSDMSCRRCLTCSITPFAIRAADRRIL
jgi:hypothetical protein